MRSGRGGLLRIGRNWIGLVGIGQVGMGQLRISR
jgi:hypothetical protein